MPNLAMLSDRELALEIVSRYIGQPYRWGGDDPMDGFDCSGLMVEALQSVGIIGRKVDMNADGMLQHFRPAVAPRAGVLVFWGTFKDGLYQRPAVHVEMCINERFSIGASGGGKTTTTLEAAIAANAFVKIRPFSTRPGIIGYRDPFA